MPELLPILIALWLLAGLMHAWLVRATRPNRRLPIGFWLVNLVIGPPAAFLVFLSRLLRYPL